MTPLLVAEDGVAVVAAVPGVVDQAVVGRLWFRGRRLSLNFATNAAGGIRVEVQESNGQPIPGFAPADCGGIFGDQLDRVVEWGVGSDVGALQGRPVRLRFALHDADLYSFQFQPSRP
ncbi:MAG: hypothetical protein WKF75_10685 [Singulisphaera sp.]